MTRLFNMTAISIFALPILVGPALVGCASNFSWSDTSTWRFESKEDQARREWREACQNEYDPDNVRVVTINGVDEYYYHTECIPYTDHPPQYMNRMEGR